LRLRIFLAPLSECWLALVAREPGSAIKDSGG
jgi:hypothetical protein